MHRKQRFPSRSRCVLYALLAVAFGSAILLVPDPAFIRMLKGATWVCTFYESTSQSGIDCSCGIYNEPIPKRAAPWAWAFTDANGVSRVPYSPSGGGYSEWFGIIWHHGSSWQAHSHPSAVPVNTRDGVVAADKLGLDGMDILNALREAVPEPLAAPYPPALLLAKENTWAGGGGSAVHDYFMVSFYRTDHAIRAVLAIASLCCLVLFARQLWKLVHMRRRIARQCCIFCGYQLADSSLNVQCPECGNIYSA